MFGVIHDRVLGCLSGCQRRTEENFQLWVRLAMHHRENLTLVKSICETTPKSLFLVPTFVPGFKNDWPVRKAIVNLPVER